MQFKKHKLYISILLFASTNYIDAMMGAKLAQAGLRSKKVISNSKTLCRKLSSEQEPASSSVLADGATGIFMGSIGAAGGFTCGGALGIIAAAVIVPPCCLANIDITVEDVVILTATPGMVIGGILGSAEAGAVGVASYGALLAGAYIIGLCKDGKEVPKKS